MAELTMRWASRSEVGRRANNEDAVFASPRLVAVADGVGGAAAGEVASGWAINEMIRLDSRRLTAELASEFRQTLERVNVALGFLISCRPELAGMGTTLTAVALSNDGEYLIANVGDSRTYVYRDGQLRRLTRDQTLVQMLVDSGAISPDEARDHPQRSVVVQALDGTERTIPPLSSCRARPGDRLLLCSDGLTDVLPDDEIAAALKGSARDAAAHRLVARALAAGGRDNISAVVADLAPREDPALGWLDALPVPGSPG